MSYLHIFDRTQLMMCSWDAFVEPESIARLIETFIDSLDFRKYGVKEAANEGRPCYDPRGMHKLYIWEPKRNPFIPETG